MKAQLSGQIFVYIMAVIIAGIILIVGSKAIVTIISTLGRVNIDDFKTQLSSEIESVSKSAGSVKKMELELSTKFDKICFVDSMIDDVFSSLTKMHIGPYPLIKNSVDNDVKKNIFLLKQDVIKDDFYVDNMVVYDAVSNKEKHFLCVENRGLVTIWLKGLGNGAHLYVE